MPAPGQIKQTARQPDLAADLARELTQQEGLVADLERRLSNREMDVRALEARVKAVETEAAQRVAEAQAQIERQAAEAHQRLMALYGSTSWRLMGPFRRTVRLVRRILGRG